MASNILVSGVDLDSLLMPIGAFTPIANVGFQVAGTDIAHRYAPVSAGIAYGTTGYSTNLGSYGGADIGTLFAKSGSVLVASAGTFTLSGQNATLSTSGATTYALTAAAFVENAFSTLYGYRSGTFGSLTPTTLKSLSVTKMYSRYDTFNSDYSDFVAVSSATDPGHTLFTSITVGSKVRNTTGATYTYIGTEAVWEWSAAPTTILFPSTGTYTVVIA